MDKFLKDFIKEKSFNEESLKSFLDDIYDYLKDNDEILFGDLSDTFYALKRFPSVEEEESILESGKILFGNKDDEENVFEFKVLITKK